MLAMQKNWNKNWFIEIPCLTVLFYAVRKDLNKVVFKFDLKNKKESAISILEERTVHIGEMAYAKVLCFGAEGFEGRLLLLEQRG